MKDKKQRGEPKIEALLKYANNIIATLREPFLVLDKKLQVISANQVFYTTFKVVEKDTIGRLLPDLGDRQWNIPKLLQLLKEIIPEKEVVKDYEVEHKFEHIGERVMVLNACQVRVPKKIAGIIAAGIEEEEEEEEEEELILLAIEDITDRREIEKGLEKTRKELAVIKQTADEVSEFAESVINTVREPLISLDQDLRVVTVSRSFYEFFKVKPEETVGQLIYDLGNKQWNIPKLRELLETILPQKTTFDNYEVEHDFTTIGRRIMLLNARQIERGMGKERIILLAIEDITERKKVEENLRAASLYARSLLEASLDPLVTISREGKITDVNEAAIKSTGVYREKLIGTDFSDYFTEPEKAREGYRQVFAKGFVSDYPLTIRRKDGELIDVLYNGTVYKDNRGNILGVFAAARDVTEFNYLQDKLIRLDKLAALGKLAGIVGHELRNPLGVIRNSVYFLKLKLASAVQDEKIKKHLDILNEEVVNSDRIITNILTFGRVKTPELALVDIPKIIQASLEKLKVPADIEVTRQIEPGLPQIQADETQLQQVFFNIIVNAIQAMSGGGRLTINAKIMDEFIELDFTDTGEGISKENLKKIFEPLFSTRTQGTGLGLTVCQDIIDVHKGNISVESEVGNGTKFTIKLPIIMEV